MMCLLIVTTALQGGCRAAVVKLSHLLPHLAVAGITITSAGRLFGTDHGSGAATSRGSSGGQSAAQWRGRRTGRLSCGGTPTPSPPPPPRKWRRRRWGCGAGAARRRCGGGRGRLHGHGRAAGVLTTRQALARARCPPSPPILPPLPFPPKLPTPVPPPSPFTTRKEPEPLATPPPPRAASYGVTRATATAAPQQTQGRQGRRVRARHGPVVGRGPGERPHRRWGASRELGIPWRPPVPANRIPFAASDSIAAGLVERIKGGFGDSIAAGLVERIKGGFGGGGVKRQLGGSLAEAGRAGRGPSRGAC
jgi:hypothetical protein